MAHEVGHLLGLGHPDAGTQNSYHVALAEGNPFNSTKCAVHLHADVQCSFDSLSFLTISHQDWPVLHS